jgi:hypothetical protein
MTEPKTAENTLCKNCGQLERTHNPDLLPENMSRWYNQCEKFEPVVSPAPSKPKDKCPHKGDAVCHPERCARVGEYPDCSYKPVSESVKPDGIKLKEEFERQFIPLEATEPRIVEICQEIAQAQHLALTADLRQLLVDAEQELDAINGKRGDSLALCLFCYATEYGASGIVHTKNCIIQRIRKAQALEVKS